MYYVYVFCIFKYSQVLDENSQELMKLKTQQTT